jgi:hypothetical protein
MPDLVSKITAAQTGKAGKGAKAPAGETKDEPPPPS